MGTKDKILESALTLFAANGYDGTSVEEIAQSVGIKAPSLYKHFKGKEDILNMLIDAAESRDEESIGSEAHIGKIPARAEESLRVTMERVRFTISDPMIRNIRRFLVQEQFRSARLAAITTRHQLDGIQRMFTKIIAGMIEKGLVIEDDPAMLAIELTSPAVLWIAQSDREPERTDEILEKIEKHIRHFCAVYMNEK